MAEEKGFLSGIKNLFIEETPGTRAAEDPAEAPLDEDPLAAIRRARAEAFAGSEPPAEGDAPAPRPDGPLDPAAVYQQAGLEPQGKLEQAQTLRQNLAQSLPPETPAATRDALIKTTLSTTIPTRELLAEAQAKLQALQEYQAAADQVAQAREAEIATEIAAHEQKIATLRTAASTSAAQRMRLANEVQQAVARIRELVDLLAGGAPPPV